MIQPSYLAPRLTWPNYNSFLTHYSMTAYYINVHRHVFPNDIERTSSPPLYGYTMRSRDSFKIIIRYESRVQEIVKNGCDLRDGNSLDAGKQAGGKKVRKYIREPNRRKRKRNTKDRLLWHEATQRLCLPLPESQSLPCMCSVGERKLRGGERTRQPRKDFRLLIHQQTRVPDRARCKTPRQGSFAIVCIIRRK